MSNLNYVPSWLDSAMTLLEKLNKCIEKIETIVNTVVTVTKTANDALSLANTNEADITELQGKTTALETKTTTLETNVGAAKKEAHDAYSLANLANTTANTAQAIANGKSPKLYLHDISITISNFTVKFKKINNESEPLNNYVGESQHITNNSFDFSASGRLTDEKTCYTQVGDAHFDITYAKMDGNPFSELIYNNNFYFIDQNGALNNMPSIYKDGTPSAFTDTVSEL